MTERMSETQASLFGGLSGLSTDRQRVLDSAKHLMAVNGYERTSLEEIAHDANTTANMLLSAFGGKEAILEAVFNDSWNALNTRLADIVMAAVNMREAVLAMLVAMLHALGKDKDLESLMLFESRRQHGNNCEIRLSRGFRDFESLLVQVFRRGQKDGSFSSELEPHAAASALLGAAEGMMRDRALATMLKQRMPFSETQLRSTFEMLIRRLAP